MQNQRFEVPVIAYPLRGRINPYFWYLVPLIGLTIAAFLLSVGTLLAIILAPITFNGVPGIDQAAIVVAIVVMSIVVGICAFMFLFYIGTLFNFFDTQYVQVFIDFLNIVASILLIIVSAIALVIEGKLEATPSVFGTLVRGGSLLTASILGFAAVLCLILDLFFSRFYEYCIGNYKHQKRELLKAAELASKINNV